LFNDPHLKESGGLAKLELEDGSETEIPLLPLTFDGARLRPRAPIAAVGQHTEAVLGPLGYDSQQIKCMTGSSVVASLDRNIEAG
jgi:crotonobetainyl-CoA:carnitine CoA-transferase CaiB-like acyl-CoA transferase